MNRIVLMFSSLILRTEVLLFIRLVYQPRSFDIDQAGFMSLRIVKLQNEECGYCFYLVIPCLGKRVHS